MAKAAARAPARAAAKGKAKGGKKGKAQKAQAKGFLTPANRLLIFLTLVALVPFSLPTLVLLFFGMLPTMAAAAAPRSIGRNAWMSVGGLNFAGLSNWLFTLWFGHHTIDYAFALVRQILPLLVAYAAAGLGWMLYLSMPPLVAAYLAMTSQRRVTVLVAQQKKLVEQWGDGVIVRDAALAREAPANAGAAAAGMAKG